MFFHSLICCVSPKHQLKLTKTLQNDFLLLKTWDEVLDTVQFKHIFHTFPCTITLNRIP